MSNGRALSCSPIFASYFWFNSSEIKKTAKGTISKKSKRTGKVCTSYDRKELNRLLNKLDKNFNSDFGKSLACNLLELVLNYFDMINKKNKIWLVNELNN